MAEAAPLAPHAESGGAVGAARADATAGIAAAMTAADARIGTGSDSDSDSGADSGSSKGLGDGNLDISGDGKDNGDGTDTDMHTHTPAAAGPSHAPGAGEDGTRAPTDADASLAPPAVAQDFSRRLQGLQGAGAGMFDGARLHYLGALLRRAGSRQDGARQLLFEKLRTALEDFEVRFGAARQQAATLVRSAPPMEAQSLSQLQRLLDAGDFHALRRNLARAGQGGSSSALQSLVRELEQHPHALPAGEAPHAGASGNRGVGAVVAGAAQPELKTLSKFRNTWSRLSTEKRIAQAQGGAPKNAGPANPHMLILRSLELMQEISPAYLTRFISYADTLLCLETGDKEKAAPPKKPKSTKPAGKKSAPA